MRSHTTPSSSENLFSSLSWIFIVVKVSADIWPRPPEGWVERMAESWGLQPALLSFETLLCNFCSAVGCSCVPEQSSSWNIFFYELASSFWNRPGWRNGWCWQNREHMRERSEVGQTQKCPETRDNVSFLTAYIEYWNIEVSQTQNVQKCPSEWVS